MDFRIKTTAKVKQTWFQFEIPIIQKTIRFTIQIYKSPKTWTKGISSRCLDGRHVIFIDYDKQDLRQVKDEIVFLQKYFKLSTAYIFQTGQYSYHAIFLDKLPLKKAFQILQETNCEWSYLNSVKLVRGREWVLRIIEKGKRERPKYITYMYAKDFRQISTAHNEFLMIHYGIPKIKYKFEDNVFKIPKIDYTTGNRVD